MDIVRDAVAIMRVDFLAVGLWTGQGWVVGLGPRRIIGTKKIAVIVQNYHPEPCYFDDDEII